MGVVGRDEQRAVLVAERADHGDQPELARLRGLRLHARTARAEVLEHGAGGCAGAVEAAIADERRARREQPARAAEGMRALELAAAHPQSEQSSLARGINERSQHCRLADAGRAFEQVRRADARDGRLSASVKTSSSGSRSCIGDAERDPL